MTDQLSPDQPTTKMNNCHPITPSQQLMSTIRKEAERDNNSNSFAKEQSLITASYRAGADEQLKQCLDWFREFYKSESWMLRDLRRFRIAMRPEPPSLKERIVAAIARGDKTAALTLLDKALPGN